MRYRLLGNSGLRVSEAALGTMTFGDDWYWGIGRSMAQIALAWLRSRLAPVIPIIGARKLSQLQDNLASFDLTLSADQLKTLDEASRIELGFPHDFYAKELPRTFIYGGMRDQILA